MGLAKNRRMGLLALALALALPATASGSYVTWLLPGLLVQFAVFSGGQTAAGLADDLSKGTVDRFRSLPMARSAVLAGRTVSDLLRTAVVFVLLIVVGILIGFRSPAGLPGLVGGLAVALAFSFAWSWAMVLLGLHVKSPESVQVAGYLVLFPVTFASSVFVPTATMPVWLRLFTEHQPVTSVTNAVRGLVLGAGALPSGDSVGGDVAIALAWTVVLLLVFVPVAVRRYTRVER